MPSPRETGTVTQRYVADRILLIILYRPASEDEGIERLQDGSVLLKLSRFARLLRLKSDACFNQLLFLQATGYLTEVDFRYKYGYVRVRPAEPLARWTPPAPQ